jgi:hypothetical protein
MRNSEMQMNSIIHSVFAHQILHQHKSPAEPDLQNPSHSVHNNNSVTDTPRRQKHKNNKTFRPAPNPKHRIQCTSPYKSPMAQNIHSRSTTCRNHQNGFSGIQSSPLHGVPWLRNRGHYTRETPIG